MTYFIRRIYTGDQVEVAFGSDQAWIKVERTLRSTPHARWEHITDVIEKNAARRACHCDWAGRRYRESTNTGRARNLETGEIVEMSFGIYAKAASR